MLKEIKTNGELEEFIQFLKDNPFSPNEVKYNGQHCIFLNNKLRSKSDYSTRDLVQDYFHPEHTIMRGGPLRVYNKITLAHATGNFYVNDSDSWVRVQINCSDPKVESFYTNDQESYDKSVQRIYTKENEHRGGNTLKVIITPEELEALGFVKGKFNKQFWFHKKEIRETDMMLPYKKFDHTVRKTDIKLYHSNLVEDGYPKEEIQEKINIAMKENIKFGVDSLTYSIFEGIRYTFGIEIETCLGRLNGEDIDNLNVKAVHDGSLRDAAGNTPGGEYVTGILTGDSGLVQLHELCRVLSNSCKINQQCGVHVHVGGLDWNREDVVYSYLLGELLEQEIFAMLPTSRRDNSYCRNITPITLKYLKELSEAKSRGQYNIIIDELYNEIYKEVTYIKGNNKMRIEPVPKDIEGINAVSTLSRNIHKNVNHPLGSKCGYDKNAQRYTWLNFVTLLYLTKGEAGSWTLEFRPHSATMNFKKIRNWIKICFAFCKFVEIGKTRINSGNLSLEEVIMTVYPKTGENLMKYISERKEVFKSKSESVDYIDELSEAKSIKGVVACV